MKPIRISAEQLAQAQPKVEPGLKKYWAIQQKVEQDRSGFTDPTFRRAYNGFYRVRRGTDWQSIYFDLMHEAKTHAYDFSQVLRGLQQATGRYEASFASKLIATLDTRQPVIDSVVLGNLGCRLPPVSSKDRLGKIVALYDELKKNVDEFLMTAEGRAVVTAFKATYPSYPISEEKMVDLVMWQMR